MSSPAARDDGTSRRRILGAAAAFGAVAIGGRSVAALGGTESRNETRPDDDAATTRDVEHQAGRTEVPGEPERVVALDLTLVLGLVAVGLPPSAAIAANAEYFEPYAAKLPAGFDPAAVAELPFISDTEIDLEAIAAGEPDLILATESQQEYYDQLGQIAPMVSIERGPNGNWRERFLEAAAAVGRVDEGAEVDARYEQVIADLPAVARETSVAFIRVGGDGIVIDSGSNGFAGSVAEDAGLNVHQVAADSNDSFVMISGEQLELIADAELIVVGDRGDDFPALESFALWSRLPAVQAGSVVSLPAGIYNGGNPLAAELLLEAIGAYFA